MLPAYRRVLAVPGTALRQENRRQQRHLADHCSITGETASRPSLELSASTATDSPGARFIGTRPSSIGRFDIFDGDVRTTVSKAK